MKIYTKTGDTGQTSLLGGNRVEKNHPKLKAYGTVDELNCHIGLLIVYINQTSPELKSLISYLTQIQTELFLLGSHISCYSEKERVLYQLSEFQMNKTEQIESAIDELEKTLSPLKNFILPGGSLSSSQAHICRTVCRRSERLVSALNDHDAVWVIYLNRLSDYFFVLARHLNHVQSIKDVIWKQD